MRIEDFYDAAARAQLLLDAEVDGHTIAVDFRAPDETVLNGLALSADYSIRFAASALPNLAVGDTVSVGGEAYQVRDIRSIGDGSERRADLSRL